jgi:hypothetical protein
MSELDKVFGELEAKRSQQEKDRRERFRVTAEFLAEFFAQDVKPSKILQRHGIESHLVDNKIVLHKPQSAHYAEPLYIVVGEQGEIDVGGRSFGRYQAADKATRKSELILEIITFFDL